jgi:hypothetical protein
LEARFASSSGAGRASIAVESAAAKIQTGVKQNLADMHIFKIGFQNPYINPTHRKYNASSMLQGHGSDMEIRQEQAAGQPFTKQLTIDKRESSDVKELDDIQVKPPQQVNEQKIIEISLISPEKDPKELESISPLSMKVENIETE